MVYTFMYLYFFFFFSLLVIQFFHQLGKMLISNKFLDFGFPIWTSLFSSDAIKYFINRYLSTFIYYYYTSNHVLSAYLSLALELICMYVCMPAPIIAMITTPLHYY